MHHPLASILSSLHHNVTLQKSHHIKKLKETQSRKGKQKKRFHKVERPLMFTTVLRIALLIRGATASGI